MDKIWVLKASGKLKDKEVFAKNKGSDTRWNKIQGTCRWGSGFVECKWFF